MLRMMNSATLLPRASLRMPCRCSAIACAAVWRLLGWMLGVWASRWFLRGVNVHELVGNSSENSAMVSTASCFLALCQDGFSAMLAQ